MFRHSDDGERASGGGRRGESFRPPAAYRYGDELPAASLMLEELLKTSELHELFESYYSLIRIPVAIIDLQANVLLSSRWQRLCTQFHRVHPITCARCLECDTKMAVQLAEGQTYTIYPCLNGLTDCAAPIVIDGCHVANVFIGQFLTQAADEARFLRQAEEFGFDVEDYLAAVREVPVVDEARIPIILELLTRMTRVITNLSVERKRAVEDQSRQSIILDTIPQSIFWKDLQGRYLGCNASFARAAGLARPSDIVGKTDFDLPWPRSEAEAYRADDQAVISEGQARLHLVEPMQRADGARTVVDTSKIPLTNASGASVGIVGILEDITKRHQVQELLRDSELKYRALFETASDAILLFADGLWVDCNAGAARVYGCTREQIIGAHPSMFSPPTQPDGRPSEPEAVRLITLAFTTGPQSFEWVHCRPDGTTFPAEVSLNRVDLGGKPHILAIVRDVSERKRAEKALHEAQTLHSSIINSTTDMIWSVDPDHFGLLSFNRGLSDYFLALGVKLEVGMRPQDIFSTAEFRDRWHALYRRALEEGAYTHEYLGIAGQAVLQLTFGLLRRDGNVFGISVFAKDIAESKRAEKELRERLQLETLVADLSARFVNMDPLFLDRELEDALQRICTCLDMDACSVWQPPESEPNTVVLTHLYRREPDPPVPSRMDAREYFPWMLDRMRMTGTTFVAATLDDMPPEAARDKQTLEQLGLASVLNVPYLDADRRLSALVSFNTRSTRTFSDLLVGRIEMISRILLGWLVRARAERAMAAGRERTRLLNEMLDEAPAGVIVHDDAGCVLYANRYAARMHGYEVAEFARLKLADLVAPDARPHILDSMRVVLDQGEASFDEWHVKRDGVPIHLHILARRTRWLNQPAVLSVQADLTERERSEQALRESEARYRLLAERIADVVWILDPARGRFLYVSPSVERLCGCTVEEAMAQSLEESLAPESRESMWTEVRRLASGADPGGFRVHVVHQRRKDGSIVPTEVTMECTPEQATGKPLILGVSRDITERQQAEKSRQELQEQLNQAQKMEAIGSLAGGVAHDFNNLLSVILSYTGFVMNIMADGDPHKGELAEVNKAAERAAALTRQLLAFSRKQVFQPVLLDLNQIARGLEKMLRRILGEDVEFVLVPADDLGPTLADPSQIEQVLMNLVVNARDAMPNGGKLVIETSNVEIDELAAASLVGVAPGAFVELAVTDTGTGIDEETRARIFEPFFTTKERGKGTGLGLSTVFGIVKQSGGDIRVESEPGRGTTFRIYLPRVSSIPVPTTTRPARSSKVPTGTETVLVVEDEQVLLRVAKRILTEAGYNVLTAANGKEALDAFERHDGTIHLLLTDVIMPEINGKVLADRLAEKSAGVRVLYMSGYTDDVIGHHGVLEPGVQFIAKPFTPSGLVRKVREVLDGAMPKPVEEQEQIVDTDADAGIDPQPPSSSSFSTLPADVVSRLRESVIAARYGDILSLIELIRGTEPGLATELRTRIDHFDYDGILALLGEGKGDVTG